MTKAICFKWGTAKFGALVACKSCNVAQRTNSDYTVLLVLCDHLPSKDQLAQYSQELQSGKRLSEPRKAHVQALDTLKDQQLLPIFGAQPLAPALESTATHQPAIHLSSIKCGT